MAPASCDHQHLVECRPWYEQALTKPNGWNAAVPDMGIGGPTADTQDACCVLNRNRQAGCGEFQPHRADTRLDLVISLRWMCFFHLYRSFQSKPCCFVFDFPHYLCE